MNKQELIDHIMAETQLSAKQVHLVMDALIGALVINDSVAIRNVGKFHWVKLTAYTGRNPKTGDAVAIPGRTVLKFKAAKALAKKK